MQREGNESCAADLDQAATEGASPEDVLGSAASDPRSFAASWATERGVIPPRSLTDKPRTRSLIHLAIAALTIVATIGAGLVIFASPHKSADARRSALAVVHLVTPSTASPTVWVRAVPPGTVLAVPRSVPLPPRIVKTNGSGVEIHKVGSILLIVGLVGIILSLSLLFWYPRTVSRRALFG